MITEKELNIANTSYTKKDFYQIYPEILDSSKWISERWHPETSNESDPGVVLLKQSAFIGDKTNYNIDKNILEDFMLSATQLESMRKLCDMMGYEMKYYQSAKTNISFMWLGGKDISDDFTFTLPRFTTTIQSKEGDVTYTLIEKNIQFTKDSINETITCEAIEGEMFKLTLGDSSIISLENIDDNNRVYLPELNIAENGIFIEFANANKSDRTWTKTTNLNSVLPGNYFWKFGFDSFRQLPYIQFPDDIAQLIEDGLTIWYTRTTGANGNVSANVLTKLTSNKEFEDSDEKINIITDSDDGTINLIISNKSATINGRDAETIDEAYNSYKKTVGTFDTLVSCRDYANAIYNMVTSSTDSSPLVSNCQVGDIRTDIFRSSRVKSFNVFGDVSFDIPERDVNEDNRINNFDLYLYPLKKIANVYNPKTYEQSFKPDPDNLYDIRSRLDENKTISHQFAFADNDDLYLIKNYYKLNAKITTTYKVDAAEAKEILENIYSALYKNFNSHMVDYGKEIPFDTLLNVIKKADYRVKNVNLDEPELETRFMLTSGTEISEEENLSDLTAFDRLYLKLIAKNILAGKLPLFKYISSFENTFDRVPYVGDESGSEVIGPVIGHDTDEAKKIKTIDTLFNLPANSTNYVLKANEVIQFRSPSLRSAITYPYMVNYFFDPVNQSTIVAKNSEYQLAAGDVLYINYSESEEGEASSVHNIRYYKNSDKWYEDDNGNVTEFSGIIKVNFDMPTSRGLSRSKYGKKSGWNPSWTVINDAGGMLALGAKEQIEIRDFVKITFSQATKINKFFWLTDDGYLFEQGKTSKVLRENEYLFYTNDAENELSTLGAGTVITTSLSAQEARAKYVINYNDVNKVSVDDVASNGLAAFSDVRWKQISFDNAETLTCQEMQFITLTAGDTLVSITLPTYESGDEVLVKLGNDFSRIDGASYIMLGKPGSLTQLPNIPSFCWEVRSRYDINCSSKVTQKLGNNNHITFKNSSGTTLATLDGANSGSTPTISSNYALAKEGNNNISAVVYSLSGSEINNLKVLLFKESDEVSTDIEFNNFDEGLTKANLNNLIGSKFNILVPDNSSAAIMMIYYTKGDESSVTVNSSEDSLVKYKSIHDDDEHFSVLTLEPGLNIIHINQSCNIWFTYTGGDESGSTAGSVVIGDYDIIAGSWFGVNLELFNINSLKTEKVYYLLDTISELASDSNGNNLFYYNYPIKLIEGIDTTTSLTEHSWFDFNNIASKFVMSELDMNSLTNIMIAKQSRRF